MRRESEGEERYKNVAPTANIEHDDVLNCFGDTGERRPPEAIVICMHAMVEAGFLVHDSAVFKGGFPATESAGAYSCLMAWMIFGKLSRLEGR